MLTTLGALETLLMALAADFRGRNLHVAAKLLAAATLVEEAIRLVKIGR